MNTNELYAKLGYKGFIRSYIMQSEVGKIVLYLRYLSWEEHLKNQKGLIKKICYFFIKRARNKLGVLLGFHIPCGVFQKGLLIYHSGSIVVNANARIGRNCILHGENCIGNNGITESAPILGDFCDIGVGAKIIGNVKLGNNIRIGANAVVTKSFEGDNLILAGVPAKIITRKEPSNSDSFYKERESIK